MHVCICVKTLDSVPNVSCLQYFSPVGGESLVALQKLVVNYGRPM